MKAEEFEKLMAQMPIELEIAIGDELPEEVANIAVSMFKENFQTESFFGEPWQEVKRRMMHEVITKNGLPKVQPAASGAKGSRKILTGDTGNLGRSIQYRIEPGKVVIFSDLAYSAAHNEGTNTAGRRRNVRIPKRQFIGSHPKLEEEIRKAIKKKLEDILKAAK